MKKVVVAVVDSKGSYYALTWVLSHLFASHADTDGVVEVVLVHAEEPLHYFMHPVGPAVYATTSLIESVKKAQEENSRNVLDKAERICLEKGVRAETVVVKGDPKEMLCQAAEDMHADLLVVGSRGLGVLKRAFLGSVSDYCTRHARCPVLVVKPPKD